MLHLKSLQKLDQSWILTNAVNTPIGQDHLATTVMIGCQIHCATNSFTHKVPYKLLQRAARRQTPSDKRFIQLFFKFPQVH